MNERKKNSKLVDITELTDEELLDQRICDLKVSVQNPFLAERIEQLYEELDARGITFRPHCWLSDEWFSPDGIPGIGIPFYLAHPRLMRLERKQLLGVEGGSAEWCMKILRHEAGHAVDTAYRLRRRKSYQQTFGRVSAPYPRYYRPKPFSKNFVLHLDMWYAQSHPVEDFAETFAVWLRPRSRWRSQYKGWPALKKLEFVEECVQSLQGKTPVVRSKAFIDSIKSLNKTLREHYEYRRAYYGVGRPSFYDDDLKKIFSDEPQYAKRATASSYLRRVRVELRESVAAWTGEYPYTIDQVLSEMIERCRDLKLRMRFSPVVTKRELVIMLTVQTVNYLHQGYHRIAL